MKCGGRTSLFGYTLPRNGALELWDTETWHLRSSAPGNSRRRPRSIVWVVDEEAPKLRLISAGLHSDVTEWDVETLEPIETCSPGGGAVWGLAVQGQQLIWSLVSLEDKMLASGDSLGLVQIWDTVACVLLHRFAQHQADVLALAASSDGRTLLSGSVDAKISEFGRQKGSQDNLALDV
eukprot:s2893_g10.t1